jgi:hypothetical protein
VLEALWVWRQFPRQIASDLSRFHNRRIAEWHEGTMSSYELLELIEFLPEDGAYRFAARGGEYSERDLAFRHHANETARLRATMHAVHGGQRYEPPILQSIASRIAEAENLERTEEAREDFFGFATRNTDQFDRDLDEFEKVG